MVVEGTHLHKTGLAEMGHGFIAQFRSRVEQQLPEFCARDVRRVPEEPKLEQIKRQVCLPLLLFLLYLSSIVL